MASKSQWSIISIRPLTGLFDNRSRPADLPPGAFRWRQNFRTSSEKKLCRRDGHKRLFDTEQNHDHHFQDVVTREPITFGFESTSPSGARVLYDGTQSRISKLNENTGVWTPIVTGMGATATRWKAAALQDYIIFTNNYDNILAHQLGTNTAATIPDLVSVLNVTKAAVVIQVNGCILLMNVVQNGNRISSRIIWSDLNLPLSYDPAASGTIASFQDLDYGEDILAAALMGSTLKVYTTRGIWNGSFATATGFSFERAYGEPKNQKGCIKFANTLVSTGNDHYYMGSDGIYHYSPYLAAPERGDEEASSFDWAHSATGAIFTNADTKLDLTFCDAPVAEYIPTTDELFFSWPSSGQGQNNNLTLVLNRSQHAADIMDTGYMMLVNFRSAISEGGVCNEDQVFIGASGVDWALKEIGGIFYREFLNVSARENDVASPDYRIDGYYSILRGMIPAGLYDRDKLIRMILLDQDSSEQDTPCVVRMRVGNSRNIVDPNNESGRCSVIWRQLEDKPLDCPDQATRDEMIADNQRPDEATEFPCYEQGVFLYFELTIANEDGTAAIGGDACLQRLDFDLKALPKS